MVSFSLVALIFYARLSRFLTRTQLKLLMNKKDGEPENYATQCQIQIDLPPGAVFRVNFQLLVLWGMHGAA